jgi:hypothetical protein
MTFPEQINDNIKVNIGSDEELSQSAYDASTVFQESESKRVKIDGD